MFYAVIMAGGSGTRLWPLSRAARPKQVLPLYGGHSMIEEAVDRISPIFTPEQILVVTRAEHVPLLAELVPSLPPENFIVEPVGRGTAPAIGLAAIHLARRDPDAIMAVLTADHVITKKDVFCDALSVAAQVAQQGKLVTLGIKPSEPSTGFGYIHVGEALGQGNGFAVHAVRQFVEKPNLEAAVQMYNSGDYLFNSGMFVWGVNRILREFEAQMPILYGELSEIAASFGTDQADATIERIWPGVFKQTIDYGVMEHAAEVAVVPVDIGWSDIGSWESVPELLTADACGNTTVGPHLGIDTTNSLIYNDTRDLLVTTIGVDGLVVVAVGDAILICAKDREQDVRAVVKQLERAENSPWL